MMWRNEGYIGQKDADSQERLKMHPVQTNMLPSRYVRHKIFLRKYPNKQGSGHVTNVDSLPTKHMRQMAVGACNYLRLPPLRMLGACPNKLAKSTAKVVP